MTITVRITDDKALWERAASHPSAVPGSAFWTDDPEFCPYGEVSFLAPASLREALQEPELDPLPEPEPLYGWSDRFPVGACGGGECEWESGTWFPCTLHHRELCSRTGDV